MAQAGRRWQRTLFPWLLEYGFTQCSSDPCGFTMRGPSPREQLILGCYVDDFVRTPPQRRAGLVVRQLH
eukprot:3212211-Pleurochrysis_carterae.AAC.1